MTFRNRPTLRTIVEQQLVTARYNRSKEEYPRIEEMFDAVKWALARNPVRRAKRITRGGITGYIIKTIPWKAGLVPSLRVLYRVTEHEVTIESLTVSED